jgi:hypothetical protein
MEPGRGALVATAQLYEVDVKTVKLPEVLYMVPFVVAPNTNGVPKKEPVEEANNKLELGNELPRASVKLLPTKEPPGTGEGKTGVGLVPRATVKAEARLESPHHCEFAVTWGPTVDQGPLMY